MTKLITPCVWDIGYHCPVPALGAMYRAGTVISPGSRWADDEVAAAVGAGALHAPRGMEDHSADLLGFGLGEEFRDWLPSVGESNPSLVAAPVPTGSAVGVDLLLRCAAWAVTAFLPRPSFGP